MGSLTFCGRWAKKWKNYKPFLLRAINSYFLPFLPKFFDDFFYSLEFKKGHYFFEKGHIWPAGHRLATPDIVSCNHYDDAKKCSISSNLMKKTCIYHVKIIGFCKMRAR